ncbi:MAG: hypothetical protein MK052_02740 [Alphaproteobacteria bacterium]|nr:hypothetical protein [Alphaproteobacteria bacterium]
MEIQKYRERFDKPMEQFVDILDALPASELLQLRNVLAKQAMTQKDISFINSYCEASAHEIQMAHLQYKNCMKDEIRLLWQKKAPMLRYLLLSKDTDERG